MLLSAETFPPGEGEGFAAFLTSHVGCEQLIAATRLLGRHRNGFWLHVCCDRTVENETAGLGSLLAYGDEDRVSVDWDLLAGKLSEGALDSVGTPADLAVLRIALSLAGVLEVNLRQGFIRDVDPADMPLVVDALREAALIGTLL
ncbi:hypothetical protein ACWD0J_35565 [Streptomyces sp. NPDC003011]